MFFEQVSHLIRRESLHKPRFRLHMMLTAVVKLQLMKSFSLWKFSAPQPKTQAAETVRRVLTRILARKMQFEQRRGQLNWLFNELGFDISGFDLLGRSTQVVVHLNWICHK